MPSALFPLCLISSYRLKLKRLYFWLAVAAFVTVTPSAFAQIVGGDCIKEATGLNNPACTANDVRITQLEVIGGPVTCEIGEILNLTLKATIESGPARFDIGIWLNETGGSALSDPAGSCYRNILSPIAAAPNCNQTSGPYLDADGDACGDVPAAGVSSCSVPPAACAGGGNTCISSSRTFAVSIMCNDSDGDKRADVGSCTSWDNNTGTACGSVAAAVPGTGAKCNCGIVPIGNILIDPCAGVDCSASNTACGTASCDANGAPGNCSILTPTSVGTQCRASTGDCDAAELCNGVSTQCPSDGFQPAGTACGSGTDTVCDNPDTCDAIGSCVSNNEPVATQCRADAGDCDVAEFCDGAGSCPADGFEAAGASCGNPADTDCDNPDSCNATGTCQGNSEPNTTQCRADAGDCDVAELCDGAGSCPADGFAPAGTSCGSSTDTVCDNPDACNATGSCQSNIEPVTTECRPGTGECDPAELCDGAGACPVDAFLPDGTSCAEADANLCTTPACANGTCNQSSATTTCTDPNCEVCDPTTGQCGVPPVVPNQCLAASVCRTAGFYGSHAQASKKAAKDITGSLLAAAGGSINVCGITLNNTDVNNANSAQEALCIKVGGTPKLQLVRQLTALSLNCVVSGSTANCSGLSPSIAALFADCNLACTGDGSATRTIAQCVSEVDCFNNGGEFINGSCFTGICSDNAEYCTPSNISACAVTTCDPLDLTCQVATCDPLPENCHSRPLCLDAQSLPNLCFEPTGPAGSSSDCNKAIKNSCNVTNVSSCATSSLRVGKIGGSKKKNNRKPYRRS